MSLTKNHHPILVTGLLLAATLPNMSTSAETPYTQEKIVGGKKARADAWSWMAGIVETNKSRPFCGASLIAKQWILTAAHCVKNRSPESINIIINQAHLASSDTGERKKVEQIIIHPLYRNSKILDNDLALIKLSTESIYPPLTLLPSHSNQGAPKTHAIAMGWGNSSYSDPNEFPSQLQQIDMSIISQKQCLSAYDKSIINNKTLSDNMICAGFSLETKGKGSCRGDSGSPLIIFDKEAQLWKQIGLTSWAEGCGLKGFYNVYTRLQNYIPFISATICTADDTPDTPLLTLSVENKTVKANWGEQKGNYRLHFAPYPKGFPIQSIDLKDLTQLSTTFNTNTAFYMAISQYKDNCSSELSNIKYFEL
jgi:secreted trypsin-like serine protease